IDRWTEWDRFLETIPESGFMQSSWWAAFRANSGYRHFGAVVRDAGRIVGGALVLKFAFSDHHSFYYVPEGPILPRDPELAEAVFQRVLEAVREHRAAEPGVVSHLR